VSVVSAGDVTDTCHTKVPIRAREHGDELAVHGGREQIDDDGRTADRVHSLVHLELHLDVREHQGQVPAEQTRAPRVRVLGVTDPQQDHRRQRFVRGGAGILHQFQQDQRGCCAVQALEAVMKQH
jgi:hypothetical protein